MKNVFKYEKGQFLAKNVNFYHNFLISKDYENLLKIVSEVVPAYPGCSQGAD